MKMLARTLAAATLTLVPAGLAWAHFGVVIPSDDIVSQGEDREIDLAIQFIHPMEGHFMQMDRPEAFGVSVRGTRQDLTDRLVEKEMHGFSTWTVDYAIQRPGDHVFYVQPTPYWEPAEDSFIVHYTKVVVNAMGMEVGWDEEVGLKTEIIPLTRPYGLWSGNVFQGVVKVEGKAVPHAEVEVEYLNTDGVAIPAGPYVTQVIKADGEGVFTYAMPREGWWGFAALNEDSATIEKDGEPKSVEIGAVLWVHTREMK